MRYKLSFLLNALFKFAFTFNSREEALAELDLPPNAKDDEIKKAYKQKAFRLHPDKNDSPTAGGDLARLNAAYEYLSKEPDKEPINYSPPVEVVDFDSMPDPTQISYEEIAEEFKNLGEDEFNKKYPGWKGEIMSEMGLDAFNSTFYGMSDADQERASYDYERYWERKAEDLKDSVKDYASEVYDNLSDSEKEEIIKHYLYDGLNLNTFFQSLEDFRVIDEIRKTIDDTDKDLRKYFGEVFIETIEKYMYMYNDIDFNIVEKESLPKLNRIGMIKTLQKASVDKLKELFLDDINKVGDFYKGITANLHGILDPLYVFRNILADRRDFEKICEIIEFPLIKMFSAEHLDRTTDLNRLPISFLEKLRNYAGTSEFRRKLVERAIQRNKTR